MSFKKSTEPCLPGVLVLPRLLPVDGPLHSVPMLVPGHGPAAAALGVRVWEEVAVDGGGQTSHGAGYGLHGGHDTLPHPRHGPGQAAAQQTHHHSCGQCGHHLHASETLVSGLQNE